MTVSCSGSIVALVTPFEAGGERVITPPGKG